VRISGAQTAISAPLTLFGPCSCSVGREAELNSMSALPGLGALMTGAKVVTGDERTVLALGLFRSTAPKPQDEKAVQDLLEFIKGRMVDGAVTTNLPGDAYRRRYRLLP
jgi:hypothetical protein